MPPRIPEPLWGLLGRAADAYTTNRNQIFLEYLHLQSVASDADRARVPSVVLSYRDSKISVYP